MKVLLHWLTAAVAGLLFGGGLLLSGMANPAKVIGFLNVTGAWDPSLALVMIGGLLVSGIGFLWLRKRTTTLLGEPLSLPSSQVIDRRLVGGAVLFGIGWGLTGICPGPGVVLLGAGLPAGVFYMGALSVGMLVFGFLQHTRSRGA